MTDTPDIPAHGDPDPFDLARFVAAQSDNYADALAELGQGRKLTHWMWYVFPQHESLGRSPTAKFYGIASLDEARAYAAHPVLGPRLRECVRQVLAVQRRTLPEIFGPVDALKFCSSMQLFAEAVPDEPLFGQARQRWC